jgi:hypothetical protein
MIHDVEKDVSLGLQGDLPVGTISDERLTFLSANQVIVGTWNLGFNRGRGKPVQLFFLALLPDKEVGIDIELYAEAGIEQTLYLREAEALFVFLKPEGRLRGRREDILAGGFEMKVILHEIVVGIHMGHHHHLDREGVGVDEVSPRRIGIENHLVGNPGPVFIEGLFSLVVPPERPVGEVDRKVISHDFQHLLGRDHVKLLGKEIETEVSGDPLQEFIKFSETLQFRFHGYSSKILSFLRNSLRVI